MEIKSASCLETRRHFVAKTTTLALGILSSASLFTSCKRQASYEEIASLPLNLRQGIATGILRQALKTSQAQEEDLINLLRSPQERSLKASLGIPEDSWISIQFAPSVKDGQIVAIILDTRAQDKVGRVVLDQKLDKVLDWDDFKAMRRLAFVETELKARLQTVLMTEERNLMQWSDLLNDEQDEIVLKFTRAVFYPGTYERRATEGDMTVQAYGLQGEFRPLKQLEVFDGEGRVLFRLKSSLDSGIKIDWEFEILRTPKQTLDDFRKYQELRKDEEQFRKTNPRRAPSNLLRA